MSYDTFAIHPDQRYYMPFKYASLSQEKNCGQQELPKDLHDKGMIRIFPDLSQSDGEPRPLALSRVTTKKPSCLAGLDSKVDSIKTRQMQPLTATSLAESFCDDHHQEQEYVFDKALRANTAIFASKDSDVLSNEQAEDWVRVFAR
jgi:hypothetical protein